MFNKKDLSSTSKPSKNYSFLTSSNILYRDQLPPQYNLPTLIDAYLPDLRGINRIDNEEQIPDIDFKNALAKFGIDASQDLSTADHNGDDHMKHDTKLRKTYSENELSKYDDISGRRKSSARDRNMVCGLSSNKEEEMFIQKFLERPKPRNEGIVDEYISNFSNFDFTKFGIDEHAVADDSDDEDTNPILSPATNYDDVGDNIERAKPIAISKENSTQNNNGLDENIKISDISFEIAASPERETDRIVLSSIPKNFQSLSFSYRRKMLTDLLPENLKNDTDYKNHITKIIRKNSASASTFSSSSSLFGSAKLRKHIPEANSNELGSILLDEWKLGRIYNRGSFGIIRECFNVQDADDVKSVKIIPIKKNLKCLKKLQTEFLMWSKLRDNSIIPLLDIKISVDYIFLLTPLYIEGSLFDRVKYWEATRISLCDRFEYIISYIRAILDSLSYLHKNGIHHGDIKLENFVLDNNVPKLCDFGMTNFDLDSYNSLESSKELDERIRHELEYVVRELSNTDSNLRDTLSFEVSNKNMKSFDRESKTLDDIKVKKVHISEHDINIGSLPYAAPELLCPCPTSVDRKADIWALGIVVFTLVILKLPFWHLYEPRLKLQILEGHWETEEWKTMLSGFPKLKNLSGLIEKCLVNRDLRSDINDVINYFMMNCL